MGLIDPQNSEVQTPPDVARAIKLMIAAGFDGTAEYKKEHVWFPDGGYTLETVTFERWDKGAKETYIADLFAKYPMITIAEASRIGLLANARSTVQTVGGAK